MRRYTALVEYLALRSEIKSLLEIGYSIKAVHEKLKSNGKVTMCYSQFHRYLHGQVKGRNFVKAVGIIERRITKPQAVEEIIPIEEPKVATPEIVAEEPKIEEPELKNSEEKPKDFNPVGFNLTKE